jgi:serine/threonine protein kinase
VDKRQVWSPGSAVGSYILVAKLATGGMAEIWLARQVGLRDFERVVVVKRIIESLSADAAFVEMFLDEARIAAQLAHPNIVQVFDLGQHAGAYYIAMEYLAGEHLAAVARAAARSGTPLSTALAVKIIIHALEGLGHAHARVGINGKPLNIVHRDISPQNIVVTWDGQVKLVDFGIARAANRSTQTRGSQLKGKFAYMAPEQGRAQELDGRADLFAIGVVLYELVSRRRLWRFEDQLPILASLIGPEPIQPIQERVPDVPGELAAIIMRALEKDPAARWPDATSFRLALEEWLRAQPEAPSTDELSRLMHRLFSELIEQRAELIQRASTGELTPREVSEVLHQTVDESMPGATQPSNPHPTGPRRVGLLVALGLAALVALWWGFRLASPTREPVAAEPVAAQPVAAPDAIPETVVRVEESDAGPAANEKGSVIVVETDPTGAQVRVDGAVAGRSPLTVNEVSLGEHSIEAMLAGYGPIKRSLTVASGGARLMVLLTLPKESRKKGPVELAKGKLTLNTDPWTRVMLNDKVFGDTPLINVPLPVGTYRLRLINEKQRIDTAVEVEIRAGQVTKKALRL